MTHTRSHGGYASQATRRGEDWIACTDCTTHSRDRLQPATETPADFWRALATLTLLVAAGLAMVIALAGYVPVPS